MRKIFSLVLAICILGLAGVAQAATVTNARWGVHDGRVLRLVVSVDTPVLYNIKLDGKTLKILTEANVASTAKGSWSIKSPVAESMTLTKENSEAVLKVQLKAAISGNDYKTFALKKTQPGQDPYRIVVDIVDKKNMPAESVAAATAVKKGSWASTSGNGSWTDRFKKPGTTTAKQSASERVKQMVEQAKQQKQSGTTATTVSKGTTQGDLKKILEARRAARKAAAEKAAAEKKQQNSKTTQTTSKKTDDGVVYIKGSGKYRTSGGVSGKVITLDAGHGGSDSGAIGQAGVQEKNITLPITKRVATLLTKAGAQVHMTRTTDVDVHSAYATDRQELQARVNVAEKYNSDLFVSIHINSSVSKTVAGTSCYYYPKTANDARIASCIQNKLLAATNFNDLGIREAGFYVIKRNSMPATLLELGFISNKKEESTMNTAGYQEKAAQAIYEGIKKYFE